MNDNSLEEIQGALGDGEKTLQSAILRRWRFKITDEGAGQVQVETDRSKVRLLVSEQRIINAYRHPGAGKSELIMPLSGPINK